MKSVLPIEKIQHLLQAMLTIYPSQVEELHPVADISSLVALRERTTEVRPYPKARLVDQIQYVRNPSLLRQQRLQSPNLSKFQVTNL